MEEEVNLIDRTYPIEIYKNYMDLLKPFIEELSREDLTKLLNRRILIDCLIAAIETYHILNDMKSKLK